MQPSTFTFSTCWSNVHFALSARVGDCWVDCCSIFNVNIVQHCTTMYHGQQCTMVNIVQHCATDNNVSWSTMYNGQHCTTLHNGQQCIMVDNVQWSTGSSHNIEPAGWLVNDAGALPRNNRKERGENNGDYCSWHCYKSCSSNTATLFLKYMYSGTYMWTLKLLMARLREPSIEKNLYTGFF